MQIDLNLLTVFDAVMTERHVTHAAERAAALSGVVERLHVVPVPLSLPGVRIQMLWHQRTARDPAHAWLRTRIASLFREL